MGHRYLGSNLQTSMSRSLNLNLQAMTINVWACEVVTHIWLMMTAEPLHCGYRPLIIQTSQRNFLAVLNTTTRPSARMFDDCVFDEAICKAIWCNRHPAILTLLNMILLKPLSAKTHSMKPSTYPVSNATVESYTLAGAVRYRYGFRPSIINSFRIKGTVHLKIKTVIIYLQSRRSKPIVFWFICSTKSTWCTHKLTSLLYVYVWMLITV